MARSPGRGPSDTGIVLSEKLPVPRGRESEPRLPRMPDDGLRTKLLLALAGALVVGVIVGFVVRPKLSPDGRIAKAEAATAEAQKASATQKERAEALEKSLVTITTAKAAADKKLDEAQKAQTELASKIADAETKAKEADAVKAKLNAAVEKGTGSVSSEGDEIHLKLVDKVLFKLGDDQLTDRGKQVISRVAAALKDLPDKQVWVQGHTDDQPIVVPPPPKKPAKGAVAPAPPRFATNWELSAARALTVVHYLQDTAKLDPTRLAALAFSQYRPIPRAPKAANRRIEIVLVPRRAVLDK